MSKDDLRMWRGRFQAPTDERVQAFNASVDIDREFALEDVEGSVAHTRMLAERGILERDEAVKIIAGLEAIRDEITAGRFEWREDLEDVHMNVEYALSKRIGPLGGKLHTARSRNDQVATDFRLWLRRRIVETMASASTFVISQRPNACPRSEGRVAIRSTVHPPSRSAQRTALRISPPGFSR
jgi:argininosuccinate lyase